MATKSTAKRRIQLVVTGDGTEVAPLWFERRPESFTAGLRLKRKWLWHFTYHKDGKLHLKYNGDVPLDPKENPIDLNQGPPLNDFRGIHMLINGMTVPIDPLSLKGYKPPKSNAERICINKQQFASENLTIWAYLVESDRLDVVEAEMQRVSLGDATWHEITSINPWLVMCIRKGHQ